MFNVTNTQVVFRKEKKILYNLLNQAFNIKQTKTKYMEENSTKEIFFVLCKLFIFLSINFNIKYNKN